MKTTIELPDALMKQLKLRAVEEERTLKSLLIELLTDALGTGPSVVQDPKKVYGSLPIVKSKRKNKRAARTITPEYVAEVLWGSAE